MTNENQTIEIDQAIIDFKELTNITKKTKVLSAHLEQELVKKFPNITDLYVSVDAISVETKHHTLRRSQYSRDSWKSLPRMICNGEMKLPDTVEDFEAMKKMIQDDYEQCLGAIFYLQFRFDIN